jgi:solute carrier family 35 protein F5
MLLTSPLVVTVGLSLTIPLSLVGQIILQGQYASVLYWIGAVIVFLSFLIVNHEESKENPTQTQPHLDIAAGSSDHVVLTEEEEVAAAPPAAVIEGRRI